jgi:hypothetical protein
MIAYLDLNIFDQLEKIDKLQNSEKIYYQTLNSLLVDKHILTAFSNAHLNDLLRGYQKNPTYINNHLSSIQLLTNNLCICQYWGKPTTVFHYRDIFDFFNEKVDDLGREYESYDEFVSNSDSILQQIIEAYKYIPLPSGFTKIYTEPIFNVIFPLSKIHNTQYALQSDIYNFQIRLKSDYGLYRKFRTDILEGLIKFNKQLTKEKSLNPNSIVVPKHLKPQDIFDVYVPNSRTSENPMYSKIIDVFFKYDLAGYKSDGHFNNMFDDALHTFYASHFDFFITNDDRCKYKAEKTFERLKIKTKVIKITEIDEIVKKIGH